MKIIGRAGYYRYALAAVAVFLLTCVSMSNNTVQITDSFHPGMKKIASKGKSFKQGWNDTLASQDEKPGMQCSFTYDYWIDSIEVTQKSFYDYTGRMPVADTSPYGVGDNYPVYYVSWFDAVLYCNARSKAENLDTVYMYYGSKVLTNGSVYELAGISYDLSRDGYRLPTESEWEFAARGGTSILLFVKSGDSSQAQNYAWFTGNSSGTSHPAATKLSNSLGLYDMAGNVFEWTNDWMGSYNGQSIINSAGTLLPDASYEKVIKGGAFLYGMIYLRPTHRTATYSTILSSANEYVGFRCVRGAISNAQYLNSKSEDFTPNAVNILSGNGDLKSFTGAAESKLVFINVTGENRTLCVVDFSSTFPFVKEYTDDKNVYMPTISPDGRYVAYCSRNEGLSGTSKVTIRSLDSLGSPMVNLDADSAYIPHWWVNRTSGDTCIIYTNSAIVNSSSLWKSTKTYRQKISGGKPSGVPEELIADGSYHDGISADGRYIVTAYSSLMMRKLETGEERQLFLSPYNGKDANGSTQVCNTSMAPDTTGRCLFLDFGYSGTSTLTGGSYGIHQYMFVSDFTDSVLNVLRCPSDEDSWDFPKWTNQPQFAISCCQNSAAQTHAIYVVDLKNQSYKSIITGVEVQQPYLWIGEISSNPLNLDLDSLGLYNDPPVEYSQGVFASKMNLFWARHDSLDVIFTGCSLIQAGIDCKVLKKYKAINMGFSSCCLMGFTTIICNYLLPHAPLLKVVGIYIPFYYFGLPMGEYTTTWWSNSIGKSKGFIYDKNHNFWKDSLPKGLDKLIVNVPCPAQEGDSLGDIVTWGCSGWGGSDPDAPDFTPWTVDDSIYKQNYASFVELIKEVSAKKVHLVAINFPESPYYKNTDHYLRYGPSWETGRAVLAQIKALEKDYPYFHVYDAYQDGNHDYTDADAHDYNHLCFDGSAKLTTRLDSLFTVILKK
jgi:uncharacterized protein (TIGR02171 family)